MYNMFFIKKKFYPSQFQKPNINQLNIFEAKLIPTFGVLKYYFDSSFKVCLVLIQFHECVEQSFHFILDR